MEPWQEPVRGAGIPLWFHAMEPDRRLHALLNGLVPTSTITHLLGIEITQTGTGSAVMTQPTSPWLQHPDGDMEVLLLAHNTLANAVMQSMPVGRAVGPLRLSYSQFRPCSAECGTFVARARVSRTTHNLAFAEGTVEDSRGRHIAQASAFIRILPLETEPVDLSTLQPVDPPQYSTQDPWQRPLPADKHKVFDAYLELPGLEAGRLVVEGRLPRTPLYELTGMRMIDIGPQTCSVTLTVTPWLSGFEGMINPGFIDTLAVTASGGGAHTLFGPGIGAACVGLEMIHVVPNVSIEDTPLLRANATAEQLADDLVVVSADVLGTGDCLIARSRYTGRPYTMHARRTASTQRVLATVLFTDIVGSTVRAGELGDARWADVLDRHHTLVRKELERQGGREVKTTGDGFLATFDSPTRALQCALSIRDGVQALGIELRAGLHTGEIEVSGADVAGITVHTAARVEGAAGAGEVWASGTVRDLVARSSFAFKDRGRQELKGIPDPVQLYSVER